MKILLYTGLLKPAEKSGVGRAIQHQQKALEENNISLRSKRLFIYTCKNVKLNKERQAF